MFQAIFRVLGYRINKTDEVIVLVGLPSGGGRR
jgi:hypothetical protein